MLPLVESVDQKIDHSDCFKLSYVHNFIIIKDK